MKTHHGVHGGQSEILKRTCDLFLPVSVGHDEIIQVSVVFCEVIPFKHRKNAWKF